MRESRSEGQRLLEFKVYYEARDLSERPEHTWCLPACVATLVHHWKLMTGAAWNVPDGKDPDYWIALWKPILGSRYGKSLFGIDISSFRSVDIGSVLKEIGAEDDLDCRVHHKVDDVLLEATRLVRADIPVIVAVATDKMFRDLGLIGRHHSVILMGRDKANNFRLFDPHKAEFETQWSTKHVRTLAPCIIQNFICAIAPQALYSFVDIDKRQMRLPGLGPEAEEEES